MLDLNVTRDILSPRKKKLFSRSCSLRQQAGPILAHTCVYIATPLPFPAVADVLHDVLHQAPGRAKFDKVRFIAERCDVTTRHSHSRRRKKPAGLVSSRW